MLEARHLVKQYHGVCALNDVSFSLGPSDVLGSSCGTSRRSTGS